MSATSHWIGSCAYCERRVQCFNGQWVDPEADGDDIVWRETCDMNDATIDAPHEPMAALFAELEAYLGDHVT